MTGYSIYTFTKWKRVEEYFIKKGLWLKMCLSKVYSGKRNKDGMIIEEAAKVLDNNGTIEIYTIFGEVSRQKDHYIKEVDLEENYIILERKVD